MLKKANIFKFLALALCIVLIVGLFGFTACESAVGKDGKSAYDIWLEQGNTGTEQDFLDSLKGAKGDQGDQGIQGPKGDQGDQGIQGPKGDKGADASGSGWRVEKTAPTESDGSVGDLWLNSEDGHVWYKEAGGWKDLGSIKGEKEDPAVDEPKEYEITINQGETAKMPISVKAGIYVIEAEFGKVSPGRLEAKVESNSSPSLFLKSESRTAAAGEGRQVLFGYIEIADGDTSISFSHAEQMSLTAEIRLKAWEQPTLKADGVPVEVPINSSDVSAEKALKVLLDSSITAGEYTMTMDWTQLPNEGVAVFDQTETMTVIPVNKSLLRLISPNGPKVFTITELANNFFVFKPSTNSAALRYIHPAIVTLTKNS